MRGKPQGIDKISGPCLTRIAHQQSVHFLRILLHWLGKIAFIFSIPENYIATNNLILLQQYSWHTSC